LSSPYIDIVQLQKNIAVSRDVKAYEILFNHFYAPLIRFSASIIRSREGAEEVYCDVMLKLWDLGTALNNIDNLKVYLFISVKNASLNYLAKYYKVQTVDIDSIAMELHYETTVEDDLVYMEFRRNLAVAIKSLPAKSQLVFKLIKEDGFSYKQVAEILGISVNTVEGHMTTALKKINASLRMYLRPNSN
jgi:RNA polymerase sigma-70 factor (family 1)